MKTNNDIKMDSIVLFKETGAIGMIREYNNFECTIDTNSSTICCDIDEAILLEEDFISKVIETAFDIGSLYGVMSTQSKGEYNVGIVSASRKNTLESLKDMICNGVTVDKLRPPKISENNMNPTEIAQFMVDQYYNLYKLDKDQIKQSYITDEM